MIINKLVELENDIQKNCQNTILLSLFSIFLVISTHNINSFDDLSLHFPTWFLPTNNFSSFLFAYFTTHISKFLCGIIPFLLLIKVFNLCMLIAVLLKQHTANDLKDTIKAAQESLQFLDSPETKQEANLAEMNMKLIHDYCSATQSARYRKFINLMATCILPMPFAFIALNLTSPYCAQLIVHIMKL